MNLKCISALMLLVSALSSVQGVANIDILQPIVRVSPAKGSVSTGDSFGFSVVLHQVEEPTDFNSAIQNTRLIVGAPHGTFPGGLPDLERSNNSAPQNITGLVYQCPVSPGECGPIGRGQLPVFDASPSGRKKRQVDPTFNAASGVRLFDDQPDGSELNTAGDTSIDEQKEGQLMGQILRSSGNHFIACAPRWTPISAGPANTFDNRKNIGRCYLSDKSLRNFVEVRPCRGDNSRPSFTLSTDNRCQAGFGTSFFSTTEGDAGILMGGPGVTSGRGRLYTYSSAEALLNSTELEEANETDQLAVSMFRHSVYDGWFVTTGNLNNDGENSYISSMPRFDGHNITGRVNIRPFSDINNIMDTIRGQQNGEYFGHTVVTADLNSDGYQEIIVGAPFYSEPGNADMGRVYVFENNMGTINDNPIILQGGSANGRFGHSVVNLGDVNGDSYEDLAIGAPYEDDPRNPNAQGAVYIHYGDPNNIINTEASQTISAESVMTVSGVSDLRSFGISLASDVDVDNNGYDDLAVGAYESQTAVLFRTRSVARIDFNLTSDKNEVQLEIDNTFTITLCATYDGRGLDGRPLNVSFVLSETPQTIRGSVTFSRTTQGLYEGTLNFPSTGERTCSDIAVDIIPISSNLPSGLRLREPIVMTVSFIQFTLPTVNVSNPLIDLRDFPLLRETGNTTVQVTPTLPCAQAACEPNLAISINNIEYRGASGAMYDAIIAGGVTSVRFYLDISNLAIDPAVNFQLAFTFPGAFFTSVTIVSPIISSVGCNNPNPNDPLNYQCTLPTYIAGNSNTEIVLDWIVATTTLTGMEGNVDVTFSVFLPPSSTDMDIDDSNNFVTRTLTITALTDPAVFPSFSGPARYSNDGPLNNDPPETLADLGEGVDITVRVTNTQPSLVPRAILELSVPINDTESDYYFLYVRDVQTPGSGMRLSCSREGINPEGFASTSRSRRRRSSLIKRQAEPDTQARSVMCPLSALTDYCQLFTCNITNLNQPVTLLVQTILDRRFYREQSGPFNFTAYARVTALDDFGQFDVNTGNNIASVTYTVLPPEVPPPNLYLEIWLPIIGAVLALILIIALFVCCIYCGFFRKKRLEKAKKAAGGEFEVRQVPPEDVAVISGEEKKVPEDFNDIGDTKDLGENPPEKDPEETSL